MKSDDTYPTRSREPPATTPRLESFIGRAKGGDGSSAAPGTAPAAAPMPTAMPKATPAGPLAATRAAATCSARFA